MIKASVKKDKKSIDLIIDTAPIRILPPHWSIFNQINIYNEETKKGIKLVEYSSRDNPRLEELQNKLPLLLKTYRPITIDDEAEAYVDEFRKEMGKKKPLYSVNLSYKDFKNVVNKAKQFEDIVKTGFITVDDLIGDCSSMLSKEDLFRVDSKEYNKYKAKLTKLERFLDKFVQSMLYFEKARDVEGEDTKLSKQNSRQGYKLLKELFK